MYSWPREPRPEDWETILPEPVPLTDVVLFGYGKDLALTISQADGRHLSMWANHVTVSTDGKVDIQVDVIDDVNLQIRYSGTGLQAQSVRLCYGKCDDDREWFRLGVREWLSHGASDALRFSVDAKIVLGSTST
jgi:hypothetical protein